MSGRLPFGPSHQRHVGPVYDWTPERMRGVRGQVSPDVAYDHAARYGRYLSGVDMPPRRTTEGEPLYDIDGTDELNALENLDDVMGSGIFDGQDRGPTANTDAGVFASNYSLPGYLAREVPFQVSQELVSLPSGAASVYVPGGGMAYVERQGELVGPSQVAPIPELPATTMHPTVGGNLQTYVPFEEEDGSWERGSPGDRSGIGNLALPLSMKRAYPSGYVHAERTTGRPTQIVDQHHDGRAAIVAPSARHPGPVFGGRALVPRARLQLRDPGRYLAPRPMRGVGQSEEPGMGVAGWLAVGLLAGVAGTILWGTVSRTGKRR